MSRKARVVFISSLGWKCLLNTLSWTMNINPGVSVFEIRRKTRVENLVPEPVSHEVVEELRNELIVMTSFTDI